MCIVKAEKSKLHTIQEVRNLDFHINCFTIYPRLEWVVLEVVKNG